jgi:hypothetical protein
MPRRRPQSRGSNQIETNRGWLLLHGLQMATKNCTSEEEFADPIQQIYELTLEGEEVVPAIEAD